jgi:very-short-patch-repair endonuclease
MQKAYDAFEQGKTIDEVRAIMGVGRNKCIKLLKEHFGFQRYSEIAKETKIRKWASAGRKALKEKGPIPRTEEWKRKISEGNKGKKRSEAVKKQISETLLKRVEEQGFWLDEEARLKAGRNSRDTKLKTGAYKKFSEKMKGRKKKPHTEETKKKMSEAKLAYYENGGKTWIEGVGHSEETKQKISENTKKQWEDGVFDDHNGLFRSNLEKDVYAYISSKYECEDSFRINRKIYDVYIPSLNTLVEVNGDYWHYNPVIYDRDHYDKSRDLHAGDIWDRDEYKVNLALENGYQIFTLWQKDLNESFESVIDAMLEEACQKRK